MLRAGSALDRYIKIRVRQHGHNTAISWQCGAKGAGCMFFFRVGGRSGGGGMIYQKLYDINIYNYSYLIF